MLSWAGHPRTNLQFDEGSRQLIMCSLLCLQGGENRQEDAEGGHLDALIACKCSSA